MKYAITSVLVVMVVRLFMSKQFAKSNRAEKDGANGVYLPDFMRSVGIFGLIFFTACAVAVWVLSSEILLAVLMVLFALLSVMMIIGWKNCRILYDDDGFTKITFWGKKKHFTYDMVTGWKDRNGAAACVYVSKEKIKIDTLAVNKAEFLSFIAEKCGK